MTYTKITSAYCENRVENTDTQFGQYICRVSSIKPGSSHNYHEALRITDTILCCQLQLISTVYRCWISVAMILQVKGCTYTLQAPRACRSQLSTR